MIIDELITLLGYKIEGKEQLAAYQRGIDGLVSRIGTVTRVISTMAVAASTAAAGGLALLGKNVIDTSAKFEGYQATLETLLGSSDKAKKALDWVTQFGATTPYEVGEVTEAFVRLKSYGLDPMDGTLRAVGDAASAMGKPLSQGVEAIADAVTGENERLKEFGITASIKGDQVTYSWIQNGKKLSATMKKTGTEVADFLKKNFEERFPNAMDRQSRTWNGMISNLSDAWVGFQRKIGDSGFFAAMERNLSNLMAYIGRLQSNGTLDRWAKNISDVLTVGAQVIGTAIERIGRHFITLADFVTRASEALAPFKWALLAIGVYLFPTIAALTAAGLAIDDFLTYLEGGESVIGDFVDAISKFLGANPQEVANVLSNIAKAAAWLVASAIGVNLFASALTSLATALGLLTSGTAVAGAGVLTRLLGIGLKGGVAAAGIGVAVMAADQYKTRHDQGLIETPEQQKRIDDFNAWRAGNKGKLFNWGGSGKEGYDRIQSPPTDVMDEGREQSLDSFLNGVQNMRGNMGKTAGNVVAPIVNDSSNKSVNTTNNITVPTTVNVQQAAQAPAAAGAAVGQAIGQAAVPPATRIEAEPAF